MIKPNIEWLLHNGELCNPGARGLTGVGGLKNIKFVDDNCLILTGESNRVDKMNFVLEGDIIVPIAINDSTVDNFVGGTRLKLRIEVMTESELTLVLIDNRDGTWKDFLRLFYKPVS